MNDFLIGIVIGLGISVVCLGILMLLERYYAGPFQSATVEDFQPHREGG